MQIINILLDVFICLIMLTSICLVNNFLNKFLINYFLDRLLNSFYSCKVHKKEHGYLSGN